VGARIVARPDRIVRSCLPPLRPLCTLPQLGEVNEAMTRHAGGPAASVHTMQRHREILHDYKQEFSKTKASIQSARDRAQLLSSVRADVRELSAVEAGAGGAAARADSANLLRERNAIHHAVRLADEVIGRAQATQGSLDEQRALFGRIRRTVLDVGARLPAVGALVGAIHTRRRRDVLVVGGTAAVCTLLLLWAVVH